MSMEDFRWHSCSRPGLSEGLDCELPEEEIRDRLRIPAASGFDAQVAVGYRHAAVLIPLICSAEGWQVLFTRRTDVVQTHKGQVSFPGGAVEPTDPNVAAAALREAEEEIGLSPQNVRILGQMDDFPTVTHYRVTPIVGRIKQPFEMRLSPDEVSRAFTIPLQWLANPIHWEERPYRMSNGETQSVVYYQEYEGELLWGITAQMTRRFIQQLGID